MDLLCKTFKVIGQQLHELMIFYTCIFVYIININREEYLGSLNIFFWIAEW